MKQISKQSVLGVAVSATSYQDTASAVADWVQESRSLANRRARYICVTDVHGVMTAQRDTTFRNILNNADMVTPDGMPIVWAMRSFGLREQSRVYGPDLMFALCQQAAKLGHRIFLFGARADTLEQLADALTEAFPGLQIAGKLSPPYRPPTPDEDLIHVRAIQESRADIVFVGLGTPKQEKWMEGHQDLLPGKILLGVGAAFDFHAGRIRQAPPWIRRAGFEWLFRLLMEPRRLWRRYLLVTPRFLPCWALQKAGILRYAGPAAPTASRTLSK